jgi:hypothetical protein
MTGNRKPGMPTSPHQTMENTAPKTRYVPSPASLTPASARHVSLPATRSRTSQNPSNPRLDRPHSFRDDTQFDTRSPQRTFGVEAELSTGVGQSAAAPLVRICLTRYVGWRLLAWQASVIAAWSSWLVAGVAIWRDWHHRNLLGFISTGALVLIGTIGRRRKNSRGEQAPTKRALRLSCCCQQPHAEDAGIGVREYRRVERPVELRSDEPGEAS